MLSSLFSKLSAPKSLAIFVIVIIAFSTSSRACFIRNCPKGGKRSMDQTLVPKRECMRCGTDGSGHCVGPNICCSARLGCQFGTPEAKICQEENRSTTPCYVPGEKCGEGGQGKCVADKVCCDSESCAENERCRLKTSLRDDLGSGDNLLELIHQLLKRVE
ncbi:vasotocin-neurophysin [Plakobranchus ocellatus]|uniref:Vasotocin-neurophysin n=1 Tax=Plakobranchus ocellatus TaxID=259542 RepID=A0AAV4CIZ8_9GAST|nr:vasotocin-neurophysin [Plakobranchus ocellatus]